MVSHRSLHQSTSALGAYLRATNVVDHDHADVRQRAAAIAGDLRDPVAQTARLFEWVRDEIPHSFDVGASVVTCSATEVLAARTGICHAKAHLLAALLRASGIAAGFVYQTLFWDTDSDAQVLHGLNGVYLGPLERWILLDARGNTNGIDARFDVNVERLAFPEDVARGERLYPTVFHDPAPTVVAALRAARDADHLRTLLPVSLEE
jgi:transglutaminase-like putative cysteine protease